MPKDKMTIGQDVQDEKEFYTLYDIASVKSYNYCMEYDKYSGREVEKMGSLYLKEGYIDGFLAGFAHKITGE